VSLVELTDARGEGVGEEPKSHDRKKAWPAITLSIPSATVRGELSLIRRYLRVKARALAQEGPRNEPETVVDAELVFHHIVI
jgi:hypothetical protein